jgi:type I site-specific restriction endonuclease
MKGQAMRDGVITEADTCREFVTPRLVEGGWGAAPHAIGEQRSFTNGRIIVAGGKVRRGKQKRADYLLYYRRDYPLAVVEAKEIGLPAETGVQQAREYAEILGLKFAFATNGHRIIEIDYTAGTEREVDRYATPDELFSRTARPSPNSSTASTPPWRRRSRPTTTPTRSTADPRSRGPRPDAYCSSRTRPRSTAGCGPMCSRTKAPRLPRPRRRSRTTRRPMVSPRASPN